MINFVTDLIGGAEAISEIWLVRGDDEVLDIALTGADGTAYEMQAGDVLTLTVREVASASSPVMMQIDSLPGSSRIVIRHEDTADLRVGRYSADVQLLTQYGIRKTVWPQFDPANSTRWREQNLRNFVIVSEVTI